MVPFRSHLAEGVRIPGSPGCLFGPHRNRSILSRRKPLVGSPSVRFIRLGALGLFAVFLFPVILMAENPQAETLLNGWLNAQTNIQTWTARVIQTRTLKTLTQPLTARGRVWFQAPHLFRWEIGNPAATIAIRQAGQMVVIYPKLKRVERYPLEGQQTGPWKDTLALLEAGFSRNRADLERRFRVSDLQVTGDVCRVTMEPRSVSARRLMPQIQVAFRTNDFSLTATELTFADGSTMRNDFVDPERNVALEPALFEPEIKPDYQTVEPLRR
jgi:outer membrane lipoprotein-sorting protein